MRQLAASILGRVRLVRGRCPACASEGSQHAACETCKGYEGPFPVSESTQRRWAWRFAQQAMAPAQTAMPGLAYPATTQPLR